MKNTLGLIALAASTLISVSANASLLTDIRGVFCQGPNSSTKIDLVNKTLVSERFKSDTYEIKDVRYDEAKKQITYIQVFKNSSFGESVSVLQLASAQAYNGTVSVNMLTADGSVILECTGYLKK